MKGPYIGAKFVGTLSSQPVSSVSLSEQFTLNVHWESATNAPILSLCDSGGRSLWSRLVVPVLFGEETPRGQIVELQLTSSRKIRTGLLVSLLCDWTGGGKEAGVIILDTNYNFRSFSLDW